MLSLSRLSKKLNWTQCCHHHNCQKQLNWTQCCRHHDCQKTIELDPMLSSSRLPKNSWIGPNVVVITIVLVWSGRLISCGFVKRILTGKNVSKFAKTFLSFRSNIFFLFWIENDFEIVVTWANQSFSNELWNAVSHSGNAISMKYDMGAQLIAAAATALSWKRDQFYMYNNFEKFYAATVVQTWPFSSLYEMCIPAGQKC
jgi:hypothetical protein